jgi:hypothetical protein
MNLDNITDRWLVVLGIGTLIFALSLFVLRVPIRTIIVFFAIGIPVTLLWLYVDQKSKRQQEEARNYETMAGQECICPVCKHQQAEECIKKKCPCCIRMKGSKIDGHSVNPLQ